MTGDGIGDIWQMLQEYVTYTKENNYFIKKRNSQSRQIMHDYINNRLHDHFYHNPEIKNMISQAESMMSQGTHSPYQVAQLLLDKYFK